MEREAILLSVRPKFVERILEGKKLVELRRVRPDVRPGQGVLIYGSAPTMALVASAVVGRVDVDTPSRLWSRVREHAGVSLEEYAEYFRGAERAAGIWLSEIRPLEEAIPLWRMRQQWPWFRPPQSYCFVRVALGAGERGITAMGPRGG